MKLQTRVRLRYGDDGILTFRRPTAEEWNEFMATGFPSLRGGRLIAQSSVLARIKLFDTLLIEVENIEGENGPVTAEDHAQFPVEDKVHAIYVGFETSTQVEPLKNSNGISENG